MDDLKLRLRFFLDTYGEDKLCEAVEEVLNEQPIAHENNLKCEIHFSPKDLGEKLPPSFWVLDPQEI